MRHGDAFDNFVAECEITELEVMNVINGPTIGPSDRLGMTVFFATIIHAIIIFGVSFGVEFKPTTTPNSLDVLLIQIESSVPPEEADHIAQADQLASGSIESKKRPTSPLSGPSPVPTSGLASVVSVQSTTTNVPEPSESPVLTRKQAAEKIYSGKEHSPDKMINPRRGKNREQRNLEIAQLTAELAKKEQRYTLRPRVNYIDTLSTKSAVEAAYIKHWIDTVERIGNLNYPDEARRRKLSGSLILHVLLNNDGTVIKVEIGLRSGQQVLDDAAVRIVKLAGPFKPFPEEMRVAYDQLMVTRTWVFQGGESIVTR